MTRLPPWDISGTGASDGDVLTFDGTTDEYGPAPFAGVPLARAVGTDSTLTGGGDLSADRTLGVNTTTEAERIRDVIGAALVQGSNITIAVDDAGDTITISAAGGGTGSELLMADGVTSPPVPIENEAGDDWLYQD